MRRRKVRSRTEVRPTNSFDPQEDVAAHRCPTRDSTKKAASAVRQTPSKSPRGRGGRKTLLGRPPGPAGDDQAALFLGLQNRCQLAEIVLIMSCAASRGRRPMRCWLRTKVWTFGLQRVFFSSSSRSRKRASAAPQNSEVPTQPVSAVASRTALFQRISARLRETPALLACQGKSFGDFMTVAPWGSTKHAGFMPTSFWAAIMVRRNIDIFRVKLLLCKGFKP